MLPTGGLFKHPLRPSPGLRQPRELLTGTDWEDMVQTMTNALSYALGAVRGETRKVRVFGNAQTGLMWAVGRHFDRTTTAELYGYGNEVITNKSQERRTSLAGGNSDSARRVDDASAVLSVNQAEAALGIGPKEKFASTVQKVVPDLPLFWIESGTISDSEQAMQLIVDIVASIERLHQNYGICELALFWTTANHVALLAAANLASHLPLKIKFMEWDHAHAEYAHLPMPGDF